MSIITIVETNFAPLKPGVPARPTGIWRIAIDGVVAKGQHGYAKEDAWEIARRMVTEHKGYILGQKP